MNNKTATGHFLAALSLLAITVGNVLAGPGAWDQTYAPVVSGGAVYAMGLQTDGKLVVGGAFTAINSSSSRYHLARLLSDGTLDSTFFATGSGVYSTVWALAVQSDGRIVIGGDFTSVGGTSRYHVARLNSNGTLDGSFIPTNAINYSVLAVAVQANNAVIIGGTFIQGTFPSYNARLNADGTTDTTFSSYPNGAVYAIAIQTDGKIVIGGNFTNVNGANRYHIARLNGDGSLDNTFQNGMMGASSNVRCIQIQSDGKILIGGDFTAVNNTARNYVARLNADGSIDNGFNNSSVGIMGANGPVYSMAVQPDNNIVVGGAFTSYNSANLSHVARIYPDGTRDTTFTNFGINNIVQALAIQNDGKLLIGGAFTTINNTNWSYLGRLYGNLYPPEFIVQPASRNTNVGANVTFSAQVSNPTTTSFQWRLNGNNISGATGTTYSLYNVQFSDAGNYSVFVSDALGGTTSSNALLQVGIAPAFTSQAGSLTVTQGQSASFTVTATGTPLNYFWKKNGAFITGQTNSSLNFASVVATNAATYTCQVSNFVGSITSTGAVLTVAFPPTISVQPVGQTIGVGSNFTVSVTASGNPAVAYQWRTNGTPIPGANDTSYAINSAQLTDAGSYDVVMTNFTGSVTSSVAVVNVGYAPVVVQQPLSLTNVVGSTANFSCIVTGTLPINLQWVLFGNPLLDATNITLTITNLQPSNIGFYALTATNSFGGAVSSNATINLAGYVFDIWNGLVAYYPFNGNANDVTGNGNNGTNYGAVITTDRFATPNAAYSFNGTSAYIDCGTNIFLGAPFNQFTVSAWFKSSGVGTIISDYDAPSGGDSIFAVSLAMHGASQIETDTRSTGNDYDVLSTRNSLNNQWHQVVYIMDGLSNLLVYVDGQLDHATAYIAASNYCSNPHWRIGANEFTGVINDNFSGSIDDARIYNRALSSNEVLYLYIQESQSTLQQPVILVANLGSGPNFNLNLAGIPGQNYVLQTATNLTPPIQWLPVLTNAADTNGVWQFTDTNLNSAQKFYRITTP
jgi:uncharacterized delta-60 repeat protein